MQRLPAEAGMDLANWNWKVVHRFVWNALASACAAAVA